MKLGFIKPNFNNEKCVVLLPKDINDFENQLIIEKGFGRHLAIPDEDQTGLPDN